MADKIIRLHEYEDAPYPVATCPACKEGQAYYLIVDGYGDQWGSIVAIECVECGDRITWVRADKMEKESGNEE